MQGLDLSYSADLRADQETPTRTSWRDPRTRSIVADALELAAALVEGLRPDQIRGAVSGAKRCVRGKDAVRWVVRAIKEAFRVGVPDLEGTPEELQERLAAGHYLSRLFNERTIREALKRLSEVCRGLVRRVDTWTYQIPLEQLQAGGEQLDALGAWVDRVRALLFTRADRGSRLLTLDPSNSARRPPDTCEPSKDHAGTLSFTHTLPAGPVWAALRDLRRLGPAVEGQNGDRNTFVAACILGDHGLDPETSAALLERFSQTCDPPWKVADLRKKLASAGRNRKRPWGYKRRIGDPPPTQGAPAPTLQPVPNDSLRIWQGASPLGVFREDGLEGASRRWLRSRGLDPDRIGTLDLARTLPRGVCYPNAEIRGEPWSRAGYTLVLPTYDAAGELAGVRARWTGRGEPEGPKEVAAWRSGVVGRVFANPAARRLLAGELDVVREVAAQRQAIWVVEGGPDFLTLSHETDDPVIGVVVGAWTPELAARLPTGALLLLATHDDPAGDALAGGIVRHLAEVPIDVRRIRWCGAATEPLDVNAAHLAGALKSATSTPWPSASSSTPSTSASSTPARNSTPASDSTPSTSASSTPSTSASSTPSTSASSPPATSPPPVDSLARDLAWLPPELRDAWSKLKKTS